jgi:hypothetical protein
LQHLFFYITYSGTWLTECSGHGPNTTDIEITGITPLAVCDWETVKFYPWVCYFSYTQHPYQYRFCLWLHKTQTEDKQNYTRHRPKTNKTTQDTDRRQTKLHKTQTEDKQNYTRCCFVCLRSVSCVVLFVFGLCLV